MKVAQTTVQHKGRILEVDAIVNQLHVDHVEIRSVKHLGRTIVGWEFIELTFDNNLKFGLLKKVERLVGNTKLN